MNRTFAQKLTLLFATFVAVLGLTSGLAYGQAISGDLVGTALDPTGAAIPNAAITAVNVATNIANTATTNENGQYRFSNLPPGTYNLSATASGFTKAEVKNVPIELNKTATANLTLQIGQASTTVNVIEAPSVIDTTTAQIQNTFEARQTGDLPSTGVGLGVLNLSLLGSGVGSAGGIGVGTGPSVGGQRPRNNNFTIDGVDNNNKSVTGPQLFVPNDAVAEFSLLQNQFSPEYGHSSGGQFNEVVKTGSNEFHGMLYEYLQNRNLNAMDQQFANQGFTSNPRYDQNRLGATVGGPILKNKWFYFLNFEYNPLGQASTSGGVTSPTAEGYSMLAAIPGLNQTNLSILKQYAAPAASATGSITVAGQTIPTGTLAIAGPNFQNAYYGVASSDYNISEKDQLRGRFVWNKFSTEDNNAQLPVFYTLEPQTYYLASLAEYHTFSPTITNELRLGYNRQNQQVPAGDFKFPGLDQFPDLIFDDLGLELGPDSNAPQFTIQNTYQGVDNLTWVKGSHTLKFGTEFRKYIAPSSFTQRSRGGYEYTALDLYLRDITPDSLAQRGVGNVIYYGDQIASYSYVNDEWRVRPNFTLNLGLRYEYTTVPFSNRLQTLNAISNVPGVLVFKEPKPQTTNFAPRVGFAYSPGTSGNTSIRAGFGMAYDVLFDNIGSLSLPPQLSTTVDVTGANQPGFLAGGGISPNAAAGAVTDPVVARAQTGSYLPNQVVPYSIQWNVGVQHVFAKNYTFEARYLGTRGVHLPVQTHPNVMSAIDSTHYLPTYLQMPSAGTLSSLQYTLGDLEARSNILPQFEAAGFTNPVLTEWSPQGYSQYNGLALQLNRRFSNGLQFIGAYTWSHLIDNSTTEFGATWLTPRRPQDFQDMTAERASSALDRRHRFTLTMIYDVPFFKNSNWFMKNLVGNWEVAPIYTYESPEYFTVQSAVDSNLNGDTAGDRTIVNLGGAAHTGSGVTGINSLGQAVPTGDPSIVAYVAKNPNARYIQAGKGALANGGRNTEPTRPINDVDLTLLKRFSFGERMKLELQGQALNLFNHPQFVPGYLNDIRTILTAFSPGVHSFVSAGNVNFDNPESVFSSSPRTIQVVAKFRW